MSGLSYESYSESAKITKPLFSAKPEECEAATKSIRPFENCRRREEKENS